MAASLPLVEAQALVTGLKPEIRGLQDLLFSPEGLTMSLLATHLIVFWLSQDSNGTPPVCQCAFAIAHPGFWLARLGWGQRGLATVSALFLLWPLACGRAGAPGVAVVAAAGGANTTPGSRHALSARRQPGAAIPSPPGACAQARLSNPERCGLGKYRQRVVNG